MTYQAIQYDKNTGRIRQVLDPEDDRPAAAVAALLIPEPHEGVLTRKKLPPLDTPRADGSTSQNRLHEWQEHVSRHTGLMPADLHPSIKEHVHAKVAGVTET